ncbi:DUF5067 domain-containing protein [uncultured Enterococcus sp.]|uniref:DUF5067 domain-containing protein n=1 Tax=uncultured Enterococcus sp. TaxID=167972 RepID=UPI002AA8051E|nr:DUF5067 domain-containing protein [uncultured Enterococcus sp.]
MKKMGCLGLLLVCGIVLSGCSNGDTTKLEKQIDKISKSVDTLHERVDELSETGVDISATKSSSDSKTESSKTDDKKETKDSKEETKESSESSKKKTEPKKGIKDYTMENEKVKVTVTDVDFIENLSSNLDKDGLVIIYYTLENISSEKIATNLTILDYLYVTEEDENTENQLSWGNELYRYKEFKEDYNKSTTDVKPGGKVESATSYYIIDNSKDIRIQVGADERFGMYGENAEAEETFTAKEIAKAFKTNSKIEPE